MRIDQRNAGASVSNGTGATAVFPVDRWSLYGSQATKCTGQQNAGSVTPPTGFVNYVGVTSSSAYSVLSGDYFMIYQRIEGFNTADLMWGTANAATVTLSFWVRSSLTGTFGGSLSNNASNRSYPFTYSISAANTWEQKTVTIAGDTSGTWVTNNTTGIGVYFALGVGSTLSGTAGAWTAGNIISATGAVSVVGTNGATFYITGVQLEVGSVATPFERRPYGTELQLCQRYYEKTFNQSVAPANGATSTSFASGVNLVWRVDWNATFTSGTIATPTTFMVTKRAAPTITNYGNNSSQVNVLNFTAGTNTWSNATNVTITDRGFDQYSNTLGSSGQWGVVYFAYTANAEL
jgi:hypothetical protein